MDQQYGTVPGNKFFVFLTGKTNGAHASIVDKLKRINQREVNSPTDCDYLLVVCPVVSRVQSDIQDGLSRIPVSKPIILVVMHITFDPNHIVAESRRQVKNPLVYLTVDYLFYKSDLLNCELNHKSWAEIQSLVKDTNTQEISQTWMMNRGWQFAIIILCLLLIYYWWGSSILDPTVILLFLAVFVCLTLWMCKKPNGRMKI